MKIKKLNEDFTICKLKDYSTVNLNVPYCFTAKTDEENSLVCRTKDVPGQTLAREDGWKAFRLQGVLDFSLIGILAKIATLLAENEIGIFVISTYQTDYVLVKAYHYEKAADVLAKAGYEIQS